MADAVESALQAMRVEWVDEITPGEPPADPDWNAFSPEISGFSYSPDGNKEGQEIIGSIDFASKYRSTETVSATVAYTQAQFPVDSNDNVQDPIAYPITEDDANDYPSHTVVARREVTDGGRDGAGYREYAVVTGARPVSATLDGDPSAAEPIPQELGYEAERARTHTFHQPSSSSQLVVKSDDTSDTNDVVIENEDAGTTETVTLPGSDPNTVETSSSFGDVDAVEVQGDHAGDITFGITDGNTTPGIQTELSEKPITGSNTDGVDSLIGVPALGAGSHASDITETGPLFLGTSVTWDGGQLADGDRVHTLNLSVERDVSREPRQTTRREAIDVGNRTVDVDADIAGPYESAVKIKEFFRDKAGDLVYTFDSGETITVKNAEIMDAPDFTRQAGDTNYIPSATLAPHGDPAITISKS